MLDILSTFLAVTKKGKEFDEETVEPRGESIPKEWITQEEYSRLDVFLHIMDG